MDVRFKRSLEGERATLSAEKIFHSESAAVLFAF